MTYERRLSGTVWLGLAVAVLAVSCSGSPAQPTARPNTVPATIEPSPSAATLPTTATAAPEACPGPSAATAPGFAPHEAPEIEAVLPGTVSGRARARYSVRGRCLLDMLYSSDAEVDQVVAAFRTASYPNPADDVQLVIGWAGRSDTVNDPPYFVFAARKPANDDETALVVTLITQSTRFKDWGPTVDLAKFTERTIGGKQVEVGSLDLLEQSTYQRGRPYLYYTDQYLFLVITDNDEWAADGLGST